MEKKMLMRCLKRRKQRTFPVVLFWAMLALWPVLTQPALADHKKEKQLDRMLTPTTFIYQGCLKEGGGPANGIYNFQFVLYTAQTGGNELGSIISKENKLTDGLFRVQLDFGQAASDAHETWLQIAVRPSGRTGPYTMLSPRQRLTPTANTIFAHKERWSLIGVPVGLAGDEDKSATISDEVTNQKPASGANSISKLINTAFTSATTDNKSVPKAERRPNAAPNASCSLALPCASAVSNPLVPGFQITNTLAGTAIAGISQGGGEGVFGESTSGSGVSGLSASGTGVGGSSTSGSAGVFQIIGGNNSNPALEGNTNGTGAAVHGVNRGNKGSAGLFENTIGLNGSPTLEVRTNGTGHGGYFSINNASNTQQALVGQTIGQGVAVFGYSLGNGLAGLFRTESPNSSKDTLRVENNGKGNGLYIENSRATNAGIALFVRTYGNGTGIIARHQGNLGTALSVESLNASNSLPALFVTQAGPGPAMQVAGTAQVKVLQITGGSDLAERFEVSEAAKPGMVMAIDPNHPGSLCVARGAYNRRVAGVISGANKLDAGMVLGDLPGTGNSLPVALSGRLWVNADATKQAIEPGDLLTTADQPGYAMKVRDHARAQGAIVGKAMTSLKKGEIGQVLVLINLQ